MLNWFNSLNELQQMLVVLLAIVGWMCLMLPFIAKGADEAFLREMGTIKAHESLVWKSLKKNKSKNNT